MVAEGVVGTVAFLLSYPADVAVQYFCGFHDTAESIRLYNDPQSRIVLREGEAPSPEMQAYLSAKGKEADSSAKTYVCAEKAGMPIGIALLGGGLLLAKKSKWMQYTLMAMGAAVLFVSSGKYSSFGRPSGGW
jgi:hypothetical protein